MQVPSTLSSLWKQRRRWARGQGEALHEHFGTILHLRLWRIWTVPLETFLSLAWVVGLVVALIAATLAFLFADGPTIFGFGLAWGVAISFVCMLQLPFAVGIEARYDRPALLVFLLGPLYPLGYWAISAAAANVPTHASIAESSVSMKFSWTGKGEPSPKRYIPASKD